MPTSPFAPLLDSYLASLRDQFEVRAAAHGCLLITPFLLPDNSSLTLRLVERPGGAVEITGHGETFAYLFTSGLDLDLDDKRLEHLSSRFDVTVAGGEISKLATPETATAAINHVTNAVLDIASLIHTRNPLPTPASHLQPA